MIRALRPAIAVAVVTVLLSACSPGEDQAIEGASEAPTPEATETPTEASTEGARESGTEGARVVQPGPPGESSRVLTPEEVEELDLQPPEHTEADVRFMQQMLHHHRQALEMTGLVPERTEREDLPLFAERMEISQEDELGLIGSWLEERGEEVHDEHGFHAELMPGMLTEGHMAELEAASGTEFDRLFLERMRQHHLGALEMVEELYAADGGQEPEISQFAFHVESDQGIELSRIETMLAEIEAEQSGDVDAAEPGPTSGG